MLAANESGVAYSTFYDRVKGMPSIKENNQKKQHLVLVANNILGCADRGLPIMVDGLSVVHFPEMNPRFKFQSTDCHINRCLMTSLQYL
jgi:uncharacterized protein (DUF2342 family)